MSGEAHKRLRPSGGYRTLRSFRVATLVYDATVSFCERFLSARSRTVDQMVQAARSGRQNIAEGSRASAASSQTELRLVNVARASLDELLLDYEDFLRQRGYRLWSKDDPEAREVRAIGRRGRDRTDRTVRTDRTDQPNESSAEGRPGRPDRGDQAGRPDRGNWEEQAEAAPYAAWLKRENPEVVANTIICLIHQANYLLDQQIAALERGFVEGGGYRERLAAARIEHRRTQQDDDAPACPVCGKRMVLRTAHKGEKAGQPFWGCSGYPKCRGTRKADGAERSDRSDRSDGSN